MGRAAADTTNARRLLSPFATSHACIGSSPLPRFCRAALHELARACRTLLLHAVPLLLPQLKHMHCWQRARSNDPTRPRSPAGPLPPPRPGRPTGPPRPAPTPAASATAC